MKGKWILICGASLLLTSCMDKVGGGSLKTDDEKTIYAFGYIMGLSHEELKFI